MIHDLLHGDRGLTGILVLDGHLLLRLGLDGHTNVLGESNTCGDGERLLFLGLMHGDDIGLGSGTTIAASGVIRHHDIDADTEDTLLELDVTDSGVYVVFGGGTSLEHVTVLELHGLGTRTTELTSDDNFATLGTVLHDVSEDTVASATDGQTTEKLVTKRLALGNSAESAVLNSLGVKLDSSSGEVESLLNERGQFANATSLFSQNILGAGGTDDDLSTHGGDTDFNARVTIFTELTGEELVEFGVEDTVSDELAFLGDVGGSHVV